MKQANNNEIDLLLQSLARGRNERALQGGSMSGDGKRAHSDHLDADELNSYAEGVVPTPARPRYTAHLADCAQCRRIVIGLTQTAGVAPRYESPEPQRGSSLWQKLTAVFSPAVLRYAVPALALAGVIGISFLMLRSRPQTDRALVAQNHPVDTPSSSDQIKPNDLARGLAPATRPEEVPKTVEPVAKEANPEKGNLQDSKTVAQAPVSESEVGTPSTLKELKPPAREYDEAQSKPSYAPDPKAAAPPPATATLSSVDKSSGGIGKDQPAKREDRDEQERQRDVYANVPSDEHGPNRSAAPRSRGAVNTLRVGEPTNGPTGSDTNKKDKANEAEPITTVGGRHFKHEGNTWVDTAYDSSRATIKVARGSEQYRALIADEPGLRTIADQLRGVVIVVWKNRAYRIQ